MTHMVFRWTLFFIFSFSKRETVLIRFIPIQFSSFAFVFSIYCSFCSHCEMMINNEFWIERILKRLMNDTYCVSSNLGLFCLDLGMSTRNCRLDIELNKVFITRTPTNHSIVYIVYYWSSDSNCVWTHLICCYLVSNALERWTFHFSLSFARHEGKAKKRIAKLIIIIDLYVERRSCRNRFASEVCGACSVWFINRRILFNRFIIFFLFCIHKSKIFNEEKHHHHQQQSRNG